MDFSQIILQIPFGKFYDINGKDKELVANLRLIRYEEVEPFEPAVLFLFENTENGKHYCVYEPGAADTESQLKRFIGNEFARVEEIRPKRSDWYQTHRIYELR